MGYMRHHAIIVTGWDDNEVKAARKQAEALFNGRVSKIVPGRANGYTSFFVPPDGSEEGWETSNEGDLGREAFVGYLRSRTYEDGSSRLDWAEVQYGDDDGQTWIIEDSDARKRGAAPGGAGR